MLAMLAAFGTVFGLVGGAMAYMIVYTEYQHHGFAGRRLVGEALKAAAVAFAVFFVLSVLGSLLVGRLAK